MREARMEWYRIIFRIGRALGTILYGIAIGILISPYFLLDRPLSWNWSVVGLILLGILAFSVSVLVERRTFRRPEARGVPQSDLPG